jgi:hypothetical protein
MRARWALLTYLAALVAALAALPAQAFDAAGYGRGLLWKIERKGAAPSYVYGTIHSEDERVLTLAPPVQSAFEGATTYVMEAVLDDKAMASMGTRMMFTDGRTLQALLSPPLYGQTVAAMASYGMPEFALQQMKPWAVAMMLSMPKPKSGVFLDLMLMQGAAALGKGVAGLETVDEQLEIFDRMPMNEQVVMLEDTIKYLPELDTMFAAMHAAYLARDLAGIARLSEEQQLQGNRELGEKLMAQLLDARNRRMVQRMEAYLKQGSAFIAVGALHLPGRQGVLSLLAKKGYRVSAVY